LCHTRGHYSRSNTLEELIKGFSLRDAWTQDGSRPAFTFYHTAGTSRIDRFYLTPDLCAQKNGDADSTSSILRSVCSGTKTIYTLVSRDQTTSTVETIPLHSKGCAYTKEIKRGMGELEETETILPECDSVVGTLLRRV
jgi:hypothetical protein